MADSRISYIRTHLQEVLERADKSISNAYLFGSTARGDGHPDSDIDIVLIDATFEGIPLYKRGQCVKREWDYTGVGPLELLCFTPEEYSQRLESSQHTVVDNIEVDGVSLL